MDPDTFKNRLAKLDIEKKRLGEERAEVEGLKTKTVTIPTVWMFRQIGGELWKRTEEGPRLAEKLLRRPIPPMLIHPSAFPNPPIP